MRYSLADAAKATQGTTTAPQLMFNGVSTDTRTLKPGNLFVAIKGENFDGHDYIGQAMSAGACAVVTSRQVDAPHVLVDDTLAALGQLAAFHASMLSARVIGVTGSSGKTSTKDLLAQVLSTFGETLAPPGSFNNEIGLPSTVLAATKDTDFLVLEMGMRGLGHISYLCSIAQPEVGILLNVGSAHVELLGSADAIAQAKSEIIRDLPAHGVAVLSPMMRVCSIFGLRRMRRSSLSVNRKMPTFVLLTLRLTATVDQPWRLNTKTARILFLYS